MLRFKIENDFWILFSKIELNSKNVYFEKIEFEIWFKIIFEFNSEMWMFVELSCVSFAKNNNVVFLLWLSLTVIFFIVFWIFSELNLNFRWCFEFVDRFWIWSDCISVENQKFIEFESEIIFVDNDDFERWL